MAVGTFMIDEDGDLMGACYDDGTETLFVARSAEQVAQAATQAVSLKQGAIWFNTSAGIDYLNVFYDASKSDSFMESIRSTVLRTEILAVPGISGFADSDLIKFTRQGRTLRPEIPCVLIDCENSLVRSFIGVIA